MEEIMFFSKFEYLMTFEMKFDSEKYELKVFRILAKTSSDECVRFLRRHKAVLLGNDALFFVKENIEQFPPHLNFVSFNEYCLLPEADIYDDHVPILICSKTDRSNVTDFNKMVSSYDNDWCLLCCCKK